MMISMTFEECFIHCLNDHELLKEFDRLRGTSLSGSGSLMSELVDVASGKRTLDLAEFLKFVKECVWDRMPQESRMG